MEKKVGFMVLLLAQAAVASTVREDDVSWTEWLNDDSETSVIGFILSVAVVFVIIVVSVTAGCCKCEPDEVAEGLECCVIIVECSTCVAELLEES